MIDKIKSNSFSFHDDSFFMQLANLNKENKKLKEIIGDLECYSDRLLKLVEVLDRYVPGFRIDSSFRIHYTTDSFCRLLETDAESLYKNSIHHFLHPSTANKTVEMLNSLPGRKLPFEMEMQFITQRGHDVWVNAHFEVWNSNYSIDPGYTIVCENISGIKYLEEVSLMDSLTGLANRRRINEVLAIETERCNRYKEPLSIIFIDLDFFKKINDTYGHIIGDEILISFSAILRMQKRLMDTIGRWGGEEFIIITPGTTLEDARFIAGRIQRIIAALPFNPVGQITSSFGVTTYNMNETIDDFIDRADRALFESKKRGRNTVSVL